MTDDLGLSMDLGQIRAIVDVALARLEGEQVMRRIWARDHTVWKPSPEGIDDRLGWLDLGEVEGELEGLVVLARESGCRQAVFIGGGFGTIPDFYRAAFGVAAGFPEIGVIDTTVVEVILDWAKRLDPAKTLWVVSSRSDDTVETISLLKYFFNLAAKQLGEAEAGGHFVAIADPGTELTAIADEWGFKKLISGNPKMGDRYSALSTLGLAPGAMIGLDYAGVLERGLAMAARCGAQVSIAENPAARLGVAIAEMARAGRDKLTLLFSEKRYGKSFGVWIEQLVAQSTGKDGQGICPIVDEPLAPPSAYGPDRLFVCLDSLNGDGFEQQLESLQAAGHPLISMTVPEVADFGGQFFLWEMAMAVAGYCMGINPFDRPDVESSVASTGEMVRAFKSTGAFPKGPPLLSDGRLSIFGSVNAETPTEALRDFLEGARPPEYVSIHIYLKPSLALSVAVEELRQQIRDGLGVAVTVNYGPQLLYSTGQLHKGDAGKGIFIQLTSCVDQDAVIPDEIGFQQGVLSFATLTQALVLGDFQALNDAGRRVIRLHFDDDVVTGLSKLAQDLEFKRRTTMPP